MSSTAIASEQGPDLVDEEMERFMCETAVGLWLISARLDERAKAHGERSQLAKSQACQRLGALFAAALRDKRLSRGSVGELVAHASALALLPAHNDAQRMRAAGLLDGLLVDEVLRYVDAAAAGWPTPDEGGAEGANMSSTAIATGPQAADREVTPCVTRGPRE